MNEDALHGPVADVLIATTVSMRDFTGVIGEASRPVSRKVDLDSSLWIGRLPTGIGREVLDACEPAGLDFNPIRTYDVAYAFVRESPPVPEEAPYEWDRDQVIQRALALSRLVRPSAVGTEYSARLFLSDDRELERVIPGPVSGIRAHAFLPDPTRICWITTNDAHELSELISKYKESPLPQRLRRAFWMMEFTASVYWIDIRWPLVTSALEYLLHTERRDSTLQFVRRTQLLAKEVGLEFSHEEAGAAYDLRSSLTHGGREDLLPAHGALYEKLEEVLRLAIRRAICDPDFARVFSEDDSIRLRFPLA